ncbi:DUF6233 domain-containing protein [Streptomyces sp. MZ04]|uniref:DUF6233 domain-containing protein n=1 Tax=Streptomyces sp. MZ04 TaxID=2559236 RepID=UPI00107E8645|nr:DUF6233 domain-containing protein [Streptomyces sp. MZ04]TGB13819.1 hypothetical protein E2651_07695 [Streptomyces sp. MZ04]
MSDSPRPSRMEKLRIVRGFLAHQLDQVDRWIAEEQQRQQEKARGEEARPPAPDWLIEQGLDGRAAVYVHVGGCHMAGKRSRGVDRDQARQALYELQVDACPHCRPDTELGVLE